MLRVVLWNALKGHLVIETADPIGLNDMPLNIKRDAENEGITYDISLDFQFIEEGRLYIMDAFETCGGPDAEVRIEVWERNPNTYRWSIFTMGQVDYKNYDLSEDRAIINIEQTNFQRRTLNLLEVDVDLATTKSQDGTTLPANTGIHDDVTYHSKAILKTYDAKAEADGPYQQLNVLGENFPTCLTPGGCTRHFEQTAYGQVTFGKEKIAELEEINRTGYGYSRDGVFPIYTAAEEGTLDLNVSLALKHSVVAFETGGGFEFCDPVTHLPNKRVLAWYRHTDADDNVLDEYSFGQWTSNDGCGPAGAVGEFETKTHTQNDIAISIGDKVYVYFTWELYGDYSQPFGGFGGRMDFGFTVEADPDNTFINMTQSTIAAATQVKTCMIYEAIERCCMFYTNQVDCFRSDLLGRTDILGQDGNPLYAQDGKYALIGITNGNYLRQRLEDKKLISNLRDLLDFVNSVACIGFGFETIGSKQVLRLEKREYFYQKNLKILTLPGVADIHKKIDIKRLYNQIEYGYAGKLDIGQVNAIDEFNTIRRQIIPVIQTKNQLKVATKMRTSGYQIEFQRRLVASTKDSQLDDENFAVVLLRDGLTYKTKKNEGYAEIIGVYDAPTGYNYDISPARNYENWLPFVASSLVRSFDKTTKFTYGEVNYTAATRKTGEPSLIAENGDRDLSMVEPIVDYMNYSFNNVPITREELQLIRNNPRGYIEVIDLFGESIDGFISPKGIEYNKEDGTADFDLIKVYRKVM